MNYATIEDFDEIWKIFNENIKWFPHVRSSHIKNRLERQQVIFQDGVLITQQICQKTRKIGRNTDVYIDAGSYVIHQIINSNKGNGNAEKVMREYFAHVKTNVYLTVRSENKPANTFYEKIGMRKVGYITWSKGKLLGNVWKKDIDNDSNL